jgi:hypothetical protein
LVYPATEERPRAYYSKFRYDRSILDTSLGGSIRFRGGQIVLGYVF